MQLTRRNSRRQTLPLLRQERRLRILTIRAKTDPQPVADLRGLSPGHVAVARQAGQYCLAEAIAAELSAWRLPAERWY